MTTSTFDPAKHPTAKNGTFTEVVQSAPQISLALAGPSKVTPGAGVGYTVSESHMSREFVSVDDRPAVAERLAAEFIAEREAEGLDFDGYPAASPAYWMTQFDAYDIFEQEAPAEFTATQRDGFNSVTVKNVDLDHQSFSYNAFTTSNNERLARNVDGPYRRSSNPEHQARLTEYWDARADRLTSVREQLEALDAR